MKSNQIVKFIHLLQVFISIQLLIKVAWGVSIFLVAYINLLIRGRKAKGRNYFTKVKLNGAFLTIAYDSKWLVKSTRN
jgi:hypothetical protein